MLFKFECRGTGRYQAEAIIESRKSEKQFVVKTFESIDPRKNGHAYMARLSFANGKVGREFIDCNGKNWDRRFGIWSSKTRAASWYYSDLARYNPKDTQIKELDARPREILLASSKE